MSVDEECSISIFHRLHKTSDNVDEKELLDILNAKQAHIALSELPAY